MTTAPRKRPTAAYSLALRIRLSAAGAEIVRATEVVRAAGGTVEREETVADKSRETERILIVHTPGLDAERAVVEALGKADGVELLEIVDRTFALHEGGKLSVDATDPLRDFDDLAMSYTPGVARVCMAVHDRPDVSFSLTIRRNTVAIVSDGTAVLGLGDIGPAAAMPVMEGKAVLFKEFGGVDAFPICLDTKDPDEIVETVRRLAPTFGGVNLEDISAPRCFDIEDRLKAELDIPVFHDDQHGTAVVVMAAVINALALTGKALADMKIVVCGVGAAGVACSKILLEAGARNIVGCDRAGAIYAGRTENMNRMKDWYAENTNPDGERGTLQEVIAGADMFLGLSSPGLLAPEDVERMAPDPLVFALANPVPEIMPEEAGDRVAVMCTGRSDYPNQINNVLAFPGIFRGALDCRAQSITEGMKLAAAKAIAAVAAEDLRPDHIVPPAFDKRVAPAVAEAVRAEAVREGVAAPDALRPPTFDQIDR